MQQENTLLNIANNMSGDKFSVTQVSYIDSSNHNRYTCMLYLEFGLNLHINIENCLKHVY